jgi:hypothetical protein
MDPVVTTGSIPRLPEAGSPSAMHTQASDMEVETICCRSRLVSCPDGMLFLL